MKKGLIVTSIILGSVAVLLYAAFLILPFCLDINQYKPMVQTLVKEQIPLNIDFNNARIVTTPMLSVGLKADDIKITYQDGETLFSADKMNFRVALPSIFLLTAKVSHAQIDNPYLNLTIKEGKQFKILTLVEQIIRKQEQLSSENKDTQEEQQFDASFIRIKVPCVCLNNYKVMIDDEKSGHNLVLKGDKLKLGYFNGKTATIKTIAEVSTDDKRNITANIDVNTFIPPASEGLDEEDDKPERVELPFINPVLMYRKYDLQSDINAKLKVREKDGLIKLYGLLNIDNTTLKLADYQLPKCYFHGKFRGTKAEIDTDVVVAKDEKMKLLGFIDYGKSPKMNMHIESDKIYFADMLELAKAALNSLSIRHELDLIQGKGYIEANADINCNLKKMISNGKIIVNDGAFINRHINLGITNINFNFLFDDNSLNIKDSYAYINNAPLKINGIIDTNSLTDISVTANAIPIVGLYHAFAPNDVKKSIQILSGNTTFNTTIKGKLKEVICNLNLSLKNFAMRDKSNTFNVLNKEFDVILTADKTQTKVELENKGLKINIPQTHSVIANNSLKIDVVDTETKINPAVISINGNSKINVQGLINTAKKNQIFDLKANGTLNANDLKNFAGRDMAMFIDAKGNIPLEITVNGNNKRQNLLCRLSSSAENYITPVTISKMLNKNSILQVKVDFKENRLKIKDTGMYNRSATTDDDGKTTEYLDEIFSLNGTITNLNSAPFINVIRLRIPNSLEGSIYAFKNSKFKLDNGKLFVFGDSQSPFFKGHISLSGLNIRQLMTTLDKLNLKFSGKNLNTELNNLMLNGSDISASTDISLTPSSILNISNLRVNSRNLDLDSLMKVATVASRMFPQNSSTAVNTSSSPAPIPVELKNGYINLNGIKTGNIIVKNTASKLSLSRSNLYLNGLSTSAFDGQINGNILMNLLNNMLTIKLSGNNLDTDKLMRDAANMKDTLSGKLAFNTDISINAAETDYIKQMKSLSGNVNFDIKDGQFGPFGKVENMILAENIRESQFFQTALGGVINGLTSIDTTHFKELKGILNFKDGVIGIDEITSNGNVLTLHLFGNFDLVKNTTDMKVRGRLASVISNILGPIANVNPVNLVKVTPGLNVAAAKLFTLFTETVTKEEMDKIPAFSSKTDNFNATNFQIVVRGDVAKPLTLVKSFKWLASQEQIDLASVFVSSLPEPESLDSTIEQIEAEQAEQAKTSTKVKNFFFRKEQKEKEEQRLKTLEVINELKNSDNDVNIKEISDTKKSEK